MLDEAVYDRIISLELLLDEIISNHVWNKLFKVNLFRYIEFPERVYFEDIAIMYRFFEEISCLASTSVFQYHYRQRANSISKMNSAKSLIDYADVGIQRYRYLVEHNYFVFVEI